MRSSQHLERRGAYLRTRCRTTQLFGLGTVTLHFSQPVEQAPGRGTSSLRASRGAEGRRAVRPPGLREAAAARWQRSTASDVRPRVAGRQAHNSAYNLLRAAPSRGERGRTRSCGLVSFRCARIGERWRLIASSQHRRRHRHSRLVVVRRRRSLLSRVTRPPWTHLGHLVRHLPAAHTRARARTHRRGRPIDNNRA